MKLSFPLNISLCITGRCNFNCLHCLAAAVREKGDFPLSKVKGIIDEAADEGACRLILTGGEPFLNSNIFEICRYANSKDLDLHLNTNGSLITKPLIKEISQYSFAHIDVSIYANSSMVFNKFCRVSSKFIQKIENNVDLLLDQGLPVQIMGCITKLNWKEYFPIIRKFSEKGIKFFTLTDVHPCGAAANNYWRLAFQAQEYPNLVNAFDKVAKEHGIEIAIYVPYNGGNISLLRRYGKINSDRAGCSAGIADCNIWPDGWVTPCPYMYAPFFFAGNVFYESIKEIWIKNAFEWTRERALEGKCKTCKAGKICKGGCPADTFFLTNRITTPDPRCPFSPQDNPTFFKYGN